ncbi:MAG: endonuclease/exonuclease/phosphatase family protein, partial [Deltaproteobacteria bacterium]|nr:endonuclease/exonuclease/phosphatase family protein [Deltaproteobacteria bacterium]
MIKQFFSKPIIKRLVVVFLIFIIGFVLAFWFLTYHPKDIEKENTYCDPLAPTPSLSAGRDLKILSWNVQYMAGKKNVFFYDKPDGSGPDTRPEARDILATLKEVVRIINAETPDIVLFQELDDGAKRTDYANQLELLLSKIGKDYPCYTSSYYWKAAFVPHPKIMGPVGM